MPAVTTGQVHIWGIDLAASREDEERLLNQLSEEESERAARFQFDRDRRRYVIRHAKQRLLLASYLGGRPSEIGYEYGPYGKPRLEAPWSDGGLRFNLTSSGDLALLAVGYGFELGVDIERKRPVRDFEAIAGRFFAALEQQELASIAVSERLDAFFNCWTRKEAILKATGKGLSLGLDRFTVTMRDGAPARVIATEQSVVGDWWLSDLRPASGYVGALATSIVPDQVCCWMILD